MSTFILNLNETTVINDSIFAKVVKLSEVCQPVVMEAETNNFDWYIVATICGAVIIVASIACYAVLSWKEKEIQNDNDKQNSKKSEEGTNAIRKQKSDLLDKYLDFLKENASKDDKWIQDYKELLLGFKELLKKETADCKEVYSNNIIETEKSKIVGIIEKQMEFLKGKAAISNTKAENEYKRVLAYLIEKSQQDKMAEISQKHLMEE
jgi:hypothetical protein